MKINFDKEKSIEAVSGILQKTTDVSKKVATGVATGARDIAEKTKYNNYLRRLKKFNPLFWEDYNNESYSLPNMIMIVDDAVRKGIDVCEGAIGWTSNDSGMEVLHLYDEVIANSGIQFIPDAQCDSIYYVDRFDRKRFIKIEDLFRRAQEEKIAELKYIAYSIGAKSCSIEIIESENEIKEDKKRFSFAENMQSKFGKVSSSESYEQDTSINKRKDYRGEGAIFFDGNVEPRRPDLKWFKNVDSINRLIDMRCEGKNTIKSDELKLEGTSFSAMSVKAACAIDSAVGKIAGIKNASNMESQAMRENHSKFIFKIEF